MLLSGTTNIFTWQESSKDSKQVVYFVNIDKNINTSLKGVFEVIPTKISQS
jgi:hypothetical protein